MSRPDEMTPAPSLKVDGADAMTMTQRIGAWLKSDVTLVLPGWVLAGGGAVALLLLFVALD